MDIRNIAMRGLVKIAAGRDWNREYQKILNQQRLDWANRSGDRGYVTKPVRTEGSTRVASESGTVVPGAKMQVAGHGRQNWVNSGNSSSGYQRTVANVSAKPMRPAATAAQAAPKARRAVNPAWTTFSGGMPGKRLTLPQNDPNLRTMQGGTPGRRIG